ncbi:hypothetical protein BJY01DRAFT_249449 [Aspergillus pseudoustus]|uniref:Major facilitator superfamily domain-containing protein n=1 Tax=Aspergillus pseudoustus TaxID=1810923 RepID=A0ABR4JNS6_9EURO
MAIRTADIPIYTLSFILLLGAFSRFTHGAYTPGFYAFQEYHVPQDDSSISSRVIPFCDALVGLTLPFAGGRWRLFSIGSAFFTFTFGMGIQVANGKDFGGDLALVLLALAAFIGSFTSLE